MLVIPATRNQTGDHLIAAGFYSQMLYQLSYIAGVAPEKLLEPQRWICALLLNRLSPLGSLSADATSEASIAQSLEREAVNLKVGSLSLPGSVLPLRVCSASPKDTPTQDRIGDLQRVRLTS